MSIKNNFILFFSFLFVIGIVSAFNFETEGVTVTTFTGNITNLSQLEDTVISNPTDNQALVWDITFNRWIPQYINDSTGCSGDEILLGNGSCIRSSNLNVSSIKISWDADSDLGGYKLTNVGELIMSGLITSQNITPLTDNLYSLGNSTNWFKEIFATDVYSKNINATEINTTDLNSQDISSDRINTTNATIGGHEMYKDTDDSLNIDLG